MFFHYDLRILLVVYVDDFKSSGPVDSFERAWKMVTMSNAKSPGLELLPPGPTGKFIGCNHVVKTHYNESTEVTTRSIVYDMRDFLGSCVDLYLKLTGLEQEALCCEDSVHSQEQVASITSTPKWRFE